MCKLGLNDKINIGKNKKVFVSEIATDKATIFKYIKKGYSFDDEVLQTAGIKKTISNKKTYNVIVEHIDAEKKTFPKETASLKEILMSLHTIESQSNDSSDYEQDDNEQNDEVYVETDDFDE